MNNEEILRPKQDNIQPKQQINWFPGHMTKTRRQIEDDVKNVDSIAEIVDSRCPSSSRSKVISEICDGYPNKPRMIILNKFDIADPNITALWEKKYKADGINVLLTDCQGGKGTSGFPNLLKKIFAEKIANKAEKGVKFTPMIMVVGIPNSGKSSFVNRLVGGRKANVSDRPGVTRAKQIINCGDFILMDTAGILQPKFIDVKSAENLAFTGGIKDKIFDNIEIAEKLGKIIAKDYPDFFCGRYKANPDELCKYADEPFGMLELLANKRGFKISGGEVDFDRAAAILLDEFRGGKIGRISLERP